MRFTLALVFWAISTIAVAADHNALSGVWRVKSVLDTSPTFGMSDKQANQLIGKRLTVNASQIKVGDDVCTAPKLTFAEEKTFSFFYDGYRTDPVNLRLPESVIVVNVECSNVFSISAFFLAAKNRVVFEKRGFFFDAVRVKQ